MAREMGLKVVSTVGLILMFVAARPVNGEDVFNGISLMENCNKAVKVMDSPDSPRYADMASANACFQYLWGFKDGAHTERLVNDIKEKNYCLPNSITGQQLGRVVYKYLQDHPQELHEHRSLLVFHALSGAFPCK